MAKKDDRITHGILGDIRPKPSTEEPVRDARPGEKALPVEEDVKGMHGGSKHDETKHSGSRDVTEGVTGGLGTETGGTRNFRTGTGASRGGMGNRPAQGRCLLRPRVRGHSARAPSRRGRPTSAPRGR